MCASLRLGLHALAGGDLAEVIRQHEAKGQHIPEKQVIKWLAQLLMAVKYTHENRIIHRGTNTTREQTKQNKSQNKSKPTKLKPAG